jgi:hypothetical protein
MDCKIAILLLLLPFGTLSFSNNMSFSLNDLLDLVVGKETRGRFRSNLEDRKNTPSLTGHFISEIEHPEQFFGSDTLWVGECVACQGLIAFVLLFLRLEEENGR